MKKETRERNLMIVGLIISIGLSLVLTVINPIDSFADFSFKPF